MKKDDKNNPIEKKANLLDARWINTPFVYTEFFKGLSLLQQDIMIKVSDNIQNFINSYFSDGRNNSKDVPRPLFTEDDKEHHLEPIRITLAEYGITAGHYDQIEKAVKEILEIKAKRITHDEKGGLVIQWINIFLQGETPITTEGYTFTSKNGELKTVTRSKGWLDFRINPEVADWVFDMSKGYVNHPNIIARISTASHTPQLYSLLKHKCEQSGKGKLTVNEIKDYLGLFVKNEKTGEKTYQLPKYSQFKKYVLQKVQSDLVRMSQEKQIDITFDFHEIMPNGRKTGDPLYIEFKLHKTAMDKKKYRMAANKKIVDTLMKRCGDLKEALIEPIIIKVKDEDFSDFSSYVYQELPGIIEHHYPEDVAAYTIALLRNWVKNRLKKMQEATQLNLFEQVNEKQNYTPKKNKGEFAEEWQQILREYDGILHPVLQKAKHQGSIDGFIWIEFNTYEEYQQYIQMTEHNPSEMNTLMNTVRKVMGGMDHGRVLKTGYKKSN